MAGLVSKGRLEYANDAVTADLIATDGTSSAQAVVDRIETVAAIIIANNPTVSAAAAAATAAAIVNAQLAVLVTGTAPANPTGMFIAIGDAAGTASKLGVDTHGEVADETIQSAFTKGVPVRNGTDKVRGFGDEEGNPSWQDWTEDGLRPGRFGRPGVINAVGVVFSQSQPFVYPGHKVLWIVCDGNGIPTGKFFTVREP